MNYILQYANVSIGVIIEESCKKNFEYAKRFLETALKKKMRILMILKKRFW